MINSSSASRGLISKLDAEALLTVWCEGEYPEARAQRNTPWPASARRRPAGPYGLGHHRAVRTIEVYLGEHLCTANPTGQLTPAQTGEFREHARTEAERLGRERRRASRQARRTLAPMTGDGG